MKTLKRHNLWLYLLGIVLVCIIIWHGTIEVPFLYDDAHIVQGNIRIRDIHNIKKHIADFFSRGLLDIGYNINYYLGEKLEDGRPHPQSFHVVNLAFHVVNTMLSFLLVRLIFQGLKIYAPPDCTKYAAAVALLFSVHPIHTMTVNLIFNRAVLQSATFSLLGLILAVQALNSDKSQRQRLGLAVCAFLSLLFSISSKSIGIASFALFGLLSYYLGAKAGRRINKKVIIYTGLGLFVCILGFMLLVRSGQVWQDLPHGIRANVLTQTGVILRYLRLLAWPAGLNIDHDVPIIQSFTDWSSVISAVTAVGLLCMGFVLMFRHNLLGLCILWYFIALAPSSSIVPRGNAMIEYRVYLSTLGFSGAVVFALLGLGSLLGRHQGNAFKFFRSLPFLLYVLIVMANSVVTMQRNRIYSDPVSLWADSVSKSKGKARPHNNLGVALAEQGRTREAIRHYAKALRINPGYEESYFNLGNALQVQGKTAEAIDAYLMALRIEPANAKAHINLGNALHKHGRTAIASDHFFEALRLDPENKEAHTGLGIALQGQGEIEASIAHYYQALRTDHNYKEAHHNLGVALDALGRTAEAIYHFSEALRIDPDNAATHTELGLALKRKGKIDQALEHYLQALQKDPEYKKAHLSLADALQEKGKTAEASRHYKETLRIDPNYKEAHFNLGNVLQSQGKIKEAIGHYAEAVRIDPDFFEAHNNLAAALMRVGNIDKAVFHFKAVLRITPDNINAQKNLKRALTRQKEWNKELASLNEALRLDPDNPGHHYNLGNFYHRKNELDKAIDYYQKTLSLRPDFIPALNNIAIIYTMRAQYGKALSVFKKLASIQPEESSHFYNGACMYAKQHQVEDAVNWLKKAIEKGYDNWDLIKTDSDLENIRGSEAFKTLLKMHAP